MTDPARSAALAPGQLAAYRAARADATWSAPEAEGLLVVTGSDRVRFVHNLVSNEVKGLAAGRSNWTTLLGLKGKLLAVARLLVQPEELWLALEPEVSDVILAHLRKYKIIDKVGFEDRSAASRRLTLHGPESPAALAKVGLEVPPLGPGGNVSTPFEGGAVVIDRVDDRAGVPGFDVHAAAAPAAELARRCHQAGLTPLDPAVLEMLRIEAGWPRHGADFTEDNFPGEVELDRAVSYTKGCYLGQETIARIHARGHVNRLLRGLVCATDAPPAPGDPVLSGDKEVGRITSSCHSPRLGPIALALIHRSAADPGTRLEIGGGAQRFTATVVALPFP